MEKKLLWRSRGRWGSCDERGISLRPQSFSLRVTDFPDSWKTFIEFYSAKGQILAFVFLRLVLIFSLSNCLNSGWDFILDIHMKLQPIRINGSRNRDTITISPLTIESIEWNALLVLIIDQARHRPRSLKGCEWTSFCCGHY